MVLKMKVTIACSTMYGKEPLFLSQNNFENYIVINQCNQKNQENPNFLNFYEKGLSLSRNRAIENIDDGIVIITDNDVYFSKDTIQRVVSAFEKYSDMDILTFQFETPNGEYTKKYKNYFFKHNKFTLSKVASIEIAFRVKSIKDKGLKFNEKFGLGSVYKSSEEYIFLVDALEKGLKIGFVPEVISYHPNEASGSNFNNLELIVAKGAMIRKVFGIIGFPICFYMAFRKYKLSNYSFYKFISLMLNGFLNK